MESRYSSHKSEKKKKNDDAEEQARWNTESVCVCVWSKLSLFTTVEKTVRFSQKNTFPHFFIFAFHTSVDL